VVELPARHPRRALARQPRHLRAARRQARRPPGLAGRARGGIYSKLIAHAKQDGFCWRDATRAELETEKGASSESRFRRFKPGLDEFMALFPPSFRTDPREALLSADQIKNAFHERGWHRDFYKGLCDEAEVAGLLKTSSAGRYNQILRGRPLLVDAFEAKRDEQGTIMAQVPLAAPSIAKVRRARKRKSS